jgi:hypothetical protein
MKSVHPFRMTERCALARTVDRSRVAASGVRGVVDDHPDRRTRGCDPGFAPRAPDARRRDCRRAGNSGCGRRGGGCRPRRSARPGCAGRGRRTAAPGIDRPCDGPPPARRCGVGRFAEPGGRERPSAGSVRRADGGSRGDRGVRGDLRQPDPDRRPARLWCSGGGGWPGGRSRRSPSALSSPAWSRGR